MLFYVFLAIVLIIIAFIFSSPRLSPVPYFPSNIKDIDLILKSLSLKNGQTVVDLGAGDGLVIFEAAKLAQEKGLDTEFVGVEINPVLVGIMNIRKLFHLNRKNIRIVHGDMFEMDFGDALDLKRQTLFYLYISPWHMEKTIQNVKRQIKRFQVVSYMYEVKALRKSLKQFKGLNRIFIYKSY